MPPHEARKALDGDRVRLELVSFRGRSEGRIVGVLERQREELVGVYVERERRRGPGPPQRRRLPRAGPGAADAARPRR